MILPRQLVRRPSLALRARAIWQLPRALLAKRQRQEMSDGESFSSRYAATPTVISSCGTSRRSVRCSLSHQQKIVPQFEFVSRSTME
jgi:hypothetical protein